ncbi:MAG: cytochrome c oxidase subunit II [Deinococcota bacterium]|nr:cytochrome c oxidase subunit II [Deinococcota bacterium]
MTIRSWLQRGSGVILLAATALLAGCSLTVPQSTFDPQGPIADLTNNLFWLVFWLGSIVYALVLGVLLYIVYRFRKRSRGAGGELPPQTHGNLLFEAGWTILPAILVVVIAVPTVRDIWATETRVTDENALQIIVTGYQWWWAFEYPELGIMTANEVHIPVGRTVNFTLRSGDVLHSFWVPKLSGKRDLIPNQDNQLWFSASEPGIYHGQCSEFCLGAHAQMRLRLIAQSEDDFNAWAASFAEATQVSEQVRPPLVEQGSQLFLQRGCVQCHAIAGTAAQAVIGPDLTNFGQRTTLAAGIVANTPENLAAWLRDPQAVKPDNHMPNLQLSEDDIRALVAYLRSLGSVQSVAEGLAGGTAYGNR